MPRVTFDKRFGRYRTGDAASISRQHARVLVASGHVRLTPLVAKKVKKPEPTTQPVAAPQAIPTIESMPTVEVADAHHEAPAEAAIPVKAAPKTTATRVADQKVGK